MINFTFIIPHRNSPHLLSRCLASIPDREDTQIIVVDDNSDEDKKPVIDRGSISIIYLNSENSKGAGHARNVGLEHAKGIWVLFADADDTYTEQLISTLDTVINLGADVIYFNHYVVNGDTVQIGLSNFRENPQSGKDIYNIKYHISAPWNKLVRLNFLKKYDIWFEECPVGNDLLFSYQVGYLSQDNYLVLNVPLYNYYINSSSITHKRLNSEAYYLTRCNHILQMSSFFHFIGQKSHARSIYSLLFAIMIKKGWPQFVLAIKTYLANRKAILANQYFFINVIQSRIGR